MYYEIPTSWSKTLKTPGFAEFKNYFISINNNKKDNTIWLIHFVQGTYYHISLNFYEILVIRIIVSLSFNLKPNTPFPYLSLSHCSIMNDFGIMNCNIVTEISLTLFNKVGFTK